MILLFPKKGKPKAAGAMDFQQASFNMEEEEDEDMDAEQQDKEEEELNNNEGLMVMNDKEYEEE